MLLRMKQLSVEGYDGSLSATQKKALSTELADLNDEINSTAQRTKFNGVDLLATTSTVEGNMADIFAGNYLQTTAYGIESTGTISANTVTYSANTTSTVAVTITNPSDPAIRKLGGTTFTFEADNNVLTMQATINGEWMTDSVTISDAEYVTGAANQTSQTVTFEKFGFSIKLDTTVTTTNYADLSGTNIAATFDGKTIVMKGESSEITDIKLNGAESSTYAFSAGGSGTLAASWTDSNGQVQQDSVTLDSADFASGTYTNISFDNAGIEFQIYNYQSRTAIEIAAQVSALENYNSASQGRLVVNGSDAGTNELVFQAGANTSAYLTVNSVNVMTGTSGVTQGTASDMISVGSYISGLGDLTTADSSTTWDTAFTNLADAIDNALDYLSDVRATFGSQINRVSYITSNLTATSTNLQSARSGIVDTDFASETAKLTKGQIMQQAATAMLAQANQMPNVILSLLK
jgi:flagellin